MRAHESKVSVMKKITVVWLRRDLRLKDHHALSLALSSGLPVLPVFIFDPAILNQLEKPIDSRVDFIWQTLSGLNSELKNFAAKIYCLYSDPLQAFEMLAEKFLIQSIYCNQDYEPMAIERDSRIASFCQKRGIDFISVKDQVIFEKFEIVKADNKPYTVYTPYSKKWLSQLSAKDLAEKICDLSKADFVPQNEVPEMPTLFSMGFADSGFSFPKKSVDKSLLQSYAQARNFPALNGTSQLGIHFRFGTLSVRQAVSVAKQHSAVWLSELIWREFFMQILFHFPHVIEQSFKPDYDRIAWREPGDDFAAWCKGQTGYALVDAGMRELNATGYMHNRVRMVVASFLCKHLLIHWRHGERYFAKKLLDFDLSANNGNWQWAAGSGCDAAPYFRIFNPLTQLEKFDGDLKYTKKWVPELETANYPSPIVDHVVGRDRALNAYKAGLKSS